MARSGTFMISVKTSAAFWASFVASAISFAFLDWLCPTVAAHTIKSSDAEIKAPARPNLITLFITIPSFSDYRVSWGPNDFLLLCVSILIITRSDKRWHRLQSVVFRTEKIITDQSLCHVINHADWHSISSTNASAVRKLGLSRVVRLLHGQCLRDSSRTRVQRDS